MQELKEIHTKNFFNLINEKNYIGVEEILNNLNIDKNTAKVLLELPQLFLDRQRCLIKPEALLIFQNA